MADKSDQKRIQELRKLIAYHQKRYYEDDTPEVSDEVYDSLLNELKELEGATDETKDKILNPIGGAVNEAFSKVEHAVRQWSFGNVFIESELHDWEAKLKRHLSSEDVAYADLNYVAEHKIDGLKLILEYKAGKLVRAATRGNGVIGEDVTHTAKEIKDVPQVLTKTVDVIVVGEVWLSFDEFERINKEREKTDEALYANPRNTAAGSLRQLDATVVRDRKLSYYAYDIDAFSAKDTDIAEPQTQWEELELLKKLGHNVNPHNQKCQSINEVVKHYHKWVEKRGDLAYGADGVVIKADDVSIQKAAGYTAKSPRFGIAFKFPSEEATTIVEDIQLQVGRTGVITPVAHLKPVLIAGSTVSRATLHNEDEIKKLDVRVGDTIILKKAGDVIPKVLSVVTELRPEKTTPYRFPKKVAGCGGDGSIERVPGEAAYRCVDRSSDTLNRQRLYYFVSKQALNIDGVGPRIIDQLLDVGLISEPDDLFTLEVGDLMELEGFKEKSAQNTIEAIHQVRTLPLYRFLIGLSIDGVGEETARLLADNFGTLKNLRSSSLEKIANIYGIGDVVAQSIIDWFEVSENSTMVDRLLEYINLEETKKVSVKSELNGKSMVFTGTLPTLDRDAAKDMARQSGAKISSTVSAKTDYVVVGDNPGSKATKAEQLGLKIISEEEFLNLVA